ncbi:MAG: GNAT family N-acetyltransferase [Bacteroidota bacterium]
MSELPDIQYLTRQEIDTIKWDDCIEKAGNGLIYGYSFYLDTFSKHWDALVLGDYEAVMPLTWNKKFGIRYLYQPFLTAQLGVFGNELTEEKISFFIKKIPASFRFIEISMNSRNAEGLPAGSSTHRSNYVLDLDKPYEALYNNYRDNIQRNIRKAWQSGCSFQKGFDAEQVIELAVQQMKSQGNEEKENITHFRKLFEYLHAREMANTYGIFSSQRELIASSIFFFSHQRAYYILVGNHPAGKTVGASHALIDGFIKEYAGKKMLLDFEGSDMPNLAFFYSSFGATHEVYPAFKINRLPFFLKWMKK